MLLLLGALCTFAFAPFNFWGIIFPCLIFAFYLLLKHKSSVFWGAWCFGFAYFGAGISWVHVSIADFGGVPLVVSIMLMAMLCAYLALFPALLFHLLCSKFTSKIIPLILPLGWLLMEWLRARVLTGFPWLSVAYSQADGPLKHYFPLVGEIGLSALMVMACISAAYGLISRNRLFGSIPLVLLFSCSFVLSTLTWTQTTGDIKKIAIVQGNIPQSMRWQPELDQTTIDKYMTLTNQHWDADVIIWPEAAVPRLEMLSEPFLKQLDQLASENNTGLITGIVDYNLDTNVAYNSLIALGIDNSENTEPYFYQHKKRFSKHHLLPIGEFVPFESLLRPLAPIFDLPMSSFNRGEYVQENLQAGNVNFVPAICFEIAFPKQIAANINAQSEMIVTVSNDAWFGDSHGPHQHMQIAKVRAMEFGLPVVRATNTGVSGILNHKGETLLLLPQFKDASGVAEVQIVKGRTPYYLFGDAPIWFICALLGILGVFMHFRFAKKQNS